MSSETEPKLRGHAPRRYQPYPLGEITDNIIIQIARHLTHRFAFGQTDISGDDFGGIFAAAVKGVHRDSTLGIADVTREGCAWSVKTIKHKHPFDLRKVRLISGRNSPDYSHGISEPRKNPSVTGRAVLSIWNARLNEVLDKYKDLRIVVFIRNMTTREYVIFEEEALRFVPDDYRWKFNKPEKQGNLEGYDKTTNQHRFTWQPHGAQFTVLRAIPASARKFKITPNVPVIEMEEILKLVQFKDSWVDFIA